MDKEELKENLDKNTTEEELNAQSTENDNLEQENEEKSLETKKKEIEKLTPEEELETLKDKLARTFAEMENQRRRFEKEKEDAYEYGGYSFAKESLNLLDNLERSKAVLENDDKLKDTEALKKIIEHLNIINNDMLSIFKKNNIEPIKSINEKLDPNLHQAMMEVEDDAKEPGTIVQEIQKGFMMKDRLLRPSLVGVSKKKDKEEQKEGEKDEKNQ
ncbi:nucleotide exchange factor GrpE [Pelagibacterales bacterium SAG-MED16]|jgi:molecular chaperone GrpE|nr:nucleotide exchange factor GrpE [Pelagibacterales bacterium SAG-MED16]